MHRARKLDMNMKRMDENHEGIEKSGFKKVYGGLKKTKVQNEHERQSSGRSAFASASAL
jgi:hypothetical protein